MFSFDIIKCSILLVVVYYYQNMTSYASGVTYVKGHGFWVHEGSRSSKFVSHHNIMNVYYTHKRVEFYIPPHHTKSTSAQEVQETQYGALVEFLRSMLEQTMS